MLSYKNIWQQPQDETLTNKFRDFWAQANGPSTLDPQSVSLVTYHDDMVVGTCITTDTYSSRLGNTFFAHTVHVHPQYRRHKVATQLLLLANSYFEQQYLLGTTTNIGALLRVENKAVAEKHNEAIWDTTGFVFIGKLPEAGHIRVKYFKGARV